MSTRTDIWQKTSTQVVLGLGIALLLVAAIESSSTYDERCGWGWTKSVTYVGDGRGSREAVLGAGTWTETARDSSGAMGGRAELRWSHGRCRFEAKVTGDVGLAADNRDVVRLSDGAQLLVHEEDRDVERHLEVTAGTDGEPRYDYRVDGDEVAFDAAGRDWLAAVMPRIQRRTGTGAAERVAALYTAGGVAAVVAEIEEIPGDEVRGIYLGELLSRLREPSEIAAAVDGTAWLIRSDSAMARGLAGVPAALLADAGVREAVVKAIRTIGSDDRLRRLLEGYLADTVSAVDGAGPEVDGAVLAIAAEELPSDHEMARLLTGLLEKRPAPLPEGFAAAAATIGSDHDAGRVLRAAFAAPRGPEVAAELLEVALSIPSDHEQSKLLAAFLETCPAAAALPDVFFDVLATIESDSEQRRAAIAVVRWPGLDRATAARLLREALGMTSDDEMEELLRELVTALPEAAGLEEMERALATLGDTRREALLEEFGTLQSSSTSPDPSSSSS